MLDHYQNESIALILRLCTVTTAPVRSTKPLWKRKLEEPETECEKHAGAAACLDESGRGVDKRQMPAHTDNWRRATTTAAAESSSSVDRTRFALLQMCDDDSSNMHECVESVCFSVS